MAIQSAAGAIVQIATTSGVATYDAAGFSAKTYTTIGEITQVGEFGKNFNLIKHNPVGTRYTKKLKGSYDNGSLQFDYAYDKSDAGQTLLTTASNSDASYAFKITLQDGTIIYFTAKTMSNTTKIATVDTIVSGTAKIELDSDIVLL